MVERSPLSEPLAWNLVAEEYQAVTAPFFRHYAKAALDRAKQPENARVLDVAAGPGTLSLIAAERGHAVSAIDFAPNMISMLERAARAQNLVVDCRVGDGMALPFSDQLFDAAFSMFGLIFFPDRVQGFRELYRTLKPGGVAVVSSWQPMDRFQLLSDIFEALRSLLPNMPFGNGKAPLGELDELVSEMSQAGFHDVEAEVVSATVDLPSLEAAWDMMHRGSAPFALLRSNIGEDRWRSVESGIKDRLLEKYGPGPQQVTMTANLGIGRRPGSGG
ncbi:MAG: methyltransferase domain-containing protein [Polyangiaceae bacterium]